MSSCILSLGSINADFQVRVSEPLGSTETAAATELRRLSGGKAANVALLARRLGHEAMLLGRVGNDDLAEQVLGPLREAGVDLSAVRRATRCGTGVSMIAVPPSGKKNIVAAGEANLDWGPDDTETLCRCIRTAESGSVLVADYEVPPQAATQAIRAAHAAGLRVVLDPSYPQMVDKAVLPLVEVLTPNRSEAVALAGVQHQGDGAVEAAACALARQGARVVCIKLDDGGCLLHHEDRSWRLQAAPVRPVDSTGAGDAFTGAFAVALLEGQRVEEAAAWAVAASEVAVTAYGSQPAYPTRERLLQQLQAIDRRPVPWKG